MNYSIFWARLLGLYIVILYAGMFFHFKHFQTLAGQMTQNPVLLMVMGMFTLFLGLTIVLSHRTWRGWPILITLIGYLVVAKGIMLLFFPEWVHKVVTAWQGYNIYIAVVPGLVLGLILLICGFVVKRRL
ncbi:MAG: hypothetical protein AB7I18_05690 [Candidatus Berkiella sp.]